MHLRNTDLDLLKNRIVENNSKVVVYGAGMIGQVFIPYFITKYNLFIYIDCFVDANARKIGTTLSIGKYSYSINSPKYLNQIDSSYIILITNSKFYDVLSFLDKIEILENIDAYIIPIILLGESRKVSYMKPQKLGENQLIPKTIHYCWFGAKGKSPFLKECLLSWKKICPDYEFVEWNETNYDVSRHRYTKEAYEKGKYGLVTDLARLDILYENGGLYFDTDVSLIKKPDNLLYQAGFVGREKWGNINTGGGCGFVKGHHMLKQMIDYRDLFGYINEDGSFNNDTNGLYESNVFIKEGYVPNNDLQIINDVTVYPSYINHPYDYMSGMLDVNESTISVHHFSGGWMDVIDMDNRTKTQTAFNDIMNRIQETEKSLCANTSKTK